MEIKLQVHRTKYSEIFLDDNGILWLKPDDDAELDLEEVVACFDTYRKMGINKENRVLQIIDVKTNATMTKEGREYAANAGKAFFIASGIISNNLAVRMLVNFFNIFYKSQAVPFRLFNTEESAKKWLLKFRETI
jgi:hypothetical protein